MTSAHGVEKATCAARRMGSRMMSLPLDARGVAARLADSCMERIVLRMNSKRRGPSGFIKKLHVFQPQGSWPGTLVACSVLCMMIAVGERNVAGQSAAATGSSAKAAHHGNANHVAHPSNAQLADPKIETRVDRLLQQMTLEEKIGQLVQYNDTSALPQAPAAGGKQDAFAAVNPEAGNHANAMRLAAVGQVG